jgi:hypothetical protein
VTNVNVKVPWAQTMARKKNTELPAAILMDYLASEWKPFTCFVTVTHSIEETTSIDYLKRVMAEHPAYLLGGRC